MVSRFNIPFPFGYDYHIWQRFEALVRRFFVNERRWWHGALCAYGVLSLSSMAGMGIGSGFFALCTLFLLWRSPEQRQKFVLLARGAYGRVTILLFLAAFFSLLAAWIWPPAGEAASGLKELSKFHYFFLPLFLALAFLDGEKPLEQHPFWRFWIGMALFSTLLALLQFFGAAIFPQEWLGSRFFRSIGSSGRFHGQGLMFFHLSFASCLSFFAACGLARALWPRQGDKRWLWSLIALAGLLAVFFSYSRISWIAIGVIVVVLGFLKRPLWGLLGLMLVFATGFAAWNFSDTLRARYVDNRNGNEDRYALWLAALETAKDRPLSGVGFGRTGRYSEYYLERVLGDKPRFASHAHNNFLDALAAMGWPGLLAFLAWWGALFLMAWQAFRAAPDAERWLPAAALAGFLAFQVNGLTQVNFWDGKSQHSLMVWAGITLALHARRLQRERAAR
jgi:O-antigen ligase